jgi:NAD(P)-dependent dehydrogenase (short-subunit alcohol dehydrogenase family)
MFGPDIDATRVLPCDQSDRSKGSTFVSVSTISDVIGEIRVAAPPGIPPGKEARLALSELTDTLLRLRAAEAAREEARFLSIADRTLPIPEHRVGGSLDGATVLVTGGTGCIGTALIEQLAGHAARVVSLSRGLTSGRPVHPSAEYLRADITDRDSVDTVMAAVAPDIVFHVAGQRDPGRAETDICGTIKTNILGTRNVLESAAALGVPRTVCASTGKAMRLYSPDVYAASKRAAEWVAADIAASSAMRCSAVRFTHVVDNSIVYGKLRTWTEDPEAVLRLHAPDTAFYAQSALESARLLTLAALDPEPCLLRIHAITDLGWPVCLLDLALGMLASTGAGTPIYISGYDPGYEAISFPGLYDPMTAGDVSPLINALEAAAIVPAHSYVDTFTMPTAPGVAKLVDECLAAPSRAALSELSWALLDLAIQNADLASLEKMATFAGRRSGGLTPDHCRTLGAIRAHLDQGPR